MTAVVLIYAAAGGSSSVRAQDPPAVSSTPKGVGAHEIWFGADAGAHNWLVYTGATYSPDSDIHADGFRLRATGGYGAYDYAYSVPKSLTPAKVRVTKTYTDVLAGYQMRFGELTAKAFLGWSLLNDEIAVPRYGGRAFHTDNGPKGALELWLNLGSSAWGSLDANYADTHQTWSLRSRLGYRVLPTVSAGGEVIFNAIDRNGFVSANAAVAGNVGDLRLGGFVRYEWFGGEISASSGVSSFQQLGANGAGLLRDPALYGTVNFIMQY